MAYRIERRIVAIVVALGMAGAGVGHIGTGTAQAAFAPRSGPVFNNPKGGVAHQYAIMRQIERNIDTSPRGSVIRVAIYSITLDRFADRLIAAHRRGVHVKVLMDTHGANRIWRRLVAVLGGKVNVHKSASSYAALCSAGCVSPYRKNGRAISSLHTKYYLFSGGGKPTVTVSSANPTRAQAEVAWNNSYTVVGNKGLYGAFVRNFTDMSKGAKDDHDRNYYWTYGANPKAYFWPKARRGSDTIRNMLDLVTCSRTHQSKVRLAMFQWSDGRLAVARKLASMASKGCRVTVIYTKAQIAPSVRSTLARSRVDVRDTTHGKTRGGYAAHYTHNKYLLIDGRYNGANGRKFVLTGSANFTRNGLYHNDEANIKAVDPHVYDAYLRNFNQQIAAVPASIAKQRAEDKRPTIPLHPIEARDS
ncbi:phospholipase D-like domain-containing protein [Thermomonospora umbrina]|uniref:phospholipase D-like domain-containing protein n=1 Tax=Thermomonospora umbrina TaxID=111806 RepID=UPI001476C58C|nr:phospholipase D-like domain-containing protein [Thermomonospora umbrina]